MLCQFFWLYDTESQDELMINWGCGSGHDICYFLKWLWKITKDQSRRPTLWPRFDSETGNRNANNYTVKFSL